MCEVVLTHCVTFSLSVCLSITENWLTPDFYKHVPGLQTLVRRCMTASYQRFQSQHDVRIELCCYRSNTALKFELGFKVTVRLGAQLRAPLISEGLCVFGKQMTAPVNTLCCRDRNARCSPSSHLEGGATTAGLQHDKPSHARVGFVYLKNNQQECTCWNSFYMFTRSHSANTQPAWEELGELF